MRTGPQDHNEYESMTEETWDKVLSELDEEHRGLGATMGTWMADHRGHVGTSLRWWVPEGTLFWFVHGQCNGCRVASRQHFVGADDPAHPDPSLLKSRHPVYSKPPKESN